MFGTSGSKPSTKIDTLIGVSMRIEGDVTFSGGLRIDGTIVGNVTASPDAQSTLTISESAVVHGEVRVDHLVVNGTIVGPVRALASCELQAKAHVTGDIEYKTIEIHLGAVVQGHLVQRIESEASKQGPLKLAANNG